MRKILPVLFILFLLTSNSWATVGWNKTLPQSSENPQAISPDVIENNTAVDLMLQNYRDGKVSISLISTSEIDIGAGGVMLSNSGGSTRLMVANTTVTAMSSTNIDTGSISPSSTYYIYAYASSTTATTFSVIYSASSTSPTGITYYAKLGSFTTDGSSNFVSASSNVNTQVGLGSYSNAYGVNSVYTAATDGFVFASGTTSSSSQTYMNCLESGNPIQYALMYQNLWIMNCSMAIKKGDTWEVTTGGAGFNSTTVKWISLGS